MFFDILFLKKDVMHKDTIDTGLLSIELIINVDKTYLKVNCIYSTRLQSSYQNKIVYMLFSNNY